MHAATIVLRHLIPALQAIEKEIKEAESRELPSKEAETRIQVQPEARPKRLIGVDEAAALLGLKASTIYKYVMIRKIPFYKLGTRTIFKEQQLLEWLDGFAVEAIGPARRRRRTTT